ncbi:hypothetical protein HIM_04278 [Hirsutella minnesotensis 3608]|uniref:DASH complex subunit DAM1 n=1 Tax=Hirsutella minnesotensis 3608 TaxID=1043627 RepID=A0A0F7ZLB1_9HYPO|nr:hypothetical protein HIM_04278 [Hirsutella minnesotensis 3608]
MSAEPHDPPSAKRSNSRTRPTTPLRPSSRSSFRDSARGVGDGDAPFPLNAFEPAFAELSDAMADLEANMMHFQLMHESLARFSESFASFLYGLNMNAFCVDFPEAPITESFRRDRSEPEAQPPVNNRLENNRPENDAEMTFMYVPADCHILPQQAERLFLPACRTTDTSFVENPPPSTKSNTRTGTPEARQSRLPYARGSSTRGGPTAGRGRGRASGLARARGRGTR